jgi:predicted nucleic acid-binding Zn ribbon protein
MKTAAIAAAIERDLLRADDAPSTNIVTCFSCGFSMTYRGSRFCSDRCRDWYDVGNPGCDQDWLRQTRQPVIRPGRYGYFIRCAHCGKEFESKGLRCCSADCERGYRGRKDNLAIMAEVGIEPAAKRRCEVCSAALPKWSKGRLSKKRFCSARCQKAQRRMEMAPDSQNPVLSAET